MGSLSLVHVLAPARFGGLESVVETLAGAQKRAGESVCVAPVLVPGDDANHPFLERLVDVGVDVDPIVVGRRDYRGERGRVGALIRERKAQVVHTHGFRPDIIDAPVARTLGSVTVSTVHGFTGGSFRNRTYEYLQRRAFRHFDGIVAVSDALRVELVSAGVPDRSISVIRNAWAPTSAPFSKEAARTALAIPEGAHCVGWVGRMSAEKGLEVFIAAAAAMRSSEVLFCVVGVGPMASECRKLAEALGVADRFYWPGEVMQAGRYLKAFDIVALTSWTEGTPMVLLEAMAAGVPVVSTAVGGVPDVITAEEAHLCGAGDVDGIAVALDDALKDRSSAIARVSAATTRLTADFAVEPWTDSYRSVYLALLEAYGK
jgi:glycosyltransferase involved in cell wall biosynthesis